MAKKKRPLLPHERAQLAEKMKKYAFKKKVGVLKHVPEATWCAAIDYVLGAAAEGNALVALKEKMGFPVYWAEGEPEATTGREGRALKKPRRVVVPQWVRVKNLGHVRPDQLDLFRAHFGVVRVRVRSYVPAPGGDEEDEASYWREVEVFPAQPVLTVFKFCGVDPKKYLIGYTEMYARRFRAKEVPNGTD